MSLTEAQRHELAMHFLLLDTDSDGQLDTSDVGKLLRSVGLYPTDAEVQAVVNLVDPENTGKVGQEQMVSVVEGMRADSVSEEALREAFKLLNEDSNGYLTTAQLRHILLNLGVKLTHTEADEVIQDIEKDAEGLIPVDDLVELLLAPSSFGKQRP